MKIFFLLTMMTLLNVIPNLVKAQCTFQPLAVFGSPQYPVLTDGIQDVCDQQLVPSLANTLFDVQTVDVNVPTVANPSITFEFGFTEPFTIDPEDPNRIAGGIYVDSDQNETTGLPLGDPLNFIPCPNIAPIFQSMKQISRLGADFYIDFSAPPDPIASDEFRFPILKLNANFSTCGGSTVPALDMNNNQVFAHAKVNITGRANIMTLTIDNFGDLDANFSGGIDFLSVFGYLSTFTLASIIDPANPQTFRPSEIIPDNPTETGTFGRNSDIGFVVPPTDDSVVLLKSRQGIDFQFLDMAKKNKSDTFVAINLINGIPYSTYSVDLTSKPNLFAAVDTLFRAVTERAFGFRLDLTLIENTLRVSLTPEVSDTSITPVIERGNGPVGLIFFDQEALDKFLDSIGDTVINIQGSNVKVTSPDSVAGFRTAWSAFNSIPSINLVPPVVIDPSTISFDDIRVVPNPVLIGAPPRIRFVNIPAEVSNILIYTERGDLIKEIRHTDGGLTAQWDLLTDNGRLCAMGIYIAYFETPDGQGGFRKFVVLR